MDKKIKKYLEDIEKNYDIKILLACETGSRAWGFPSPDSDYDVRLIYKHKRDWYLSLSEEKDSIEMMLDENEIDISGWDLRKSLRLLLKSNPPLLERIQSSIIYQCDESFLAEMNIIANSLYSRIATIHHYLSMSKNCLAELDGKDSYKLKKLFYAMRAAIACKWILERTEMPPIYFPKMLESLEFPEGIKERIFELIELKASKDESYFHTNDKGLIDFVKNTIADVDVRGKHLPPGNGNSESLNEFFKRSIN